MLVSIYNSGIFGQGLSQIHVMGYAKPKPMLFDKIIGYEPGFIQVHLRRGNG